MASFVQTANQYDRINRISTLLC